MDNTKSARLDKKQRTLILQWIMEGLSDQQIIKRAAEQKKNPFTISQPLLARTYRKKAGPKVEEIMKQKETSALKEGLAIRENRVATLQWLADIMQKDIIDGKLWLKKSKTITTVGGEEEKELLIDEPIYNHQLANQFRGVLDDIAKEMGDRKGTPAINNYVIGDDAMAALRKTYNLPEPSDVIEGEYAEKEAD